MNKFTKGPWKSGINYIPYEYDYCWVEIPNGPTLSLSPAKENEANVHLIASAPDMHEALKRLVDYVEIEFEDKDMTHGLDCSVIHAKDILAKAKGVKQ